MKNRLRITLTTHGWPGGHFSPTPLHLADVTFQTVRICNNHILTIDPHFREIQGQRKNFINFDIIIFYFQINSTNIYRNHFKEILMKILKTSFLKIP